MLVWNCYCKSYHTHTQSNEWFFLTQKWVWLGFEGYSIQIVLGGSGEDNSLVSDVEKLVAHKWYYSSDFLSLLVPNSTTIHEIGVCTQVLKILRFLFSFFNLRREPFEKFQTNILARRDSSFIWLNREVEWNVKKKSIPLKLSSSRKIAVKNRSFHMMRLTCTIC